MKDPILTLPFDFEALFGATSTPVLVVEDNSRVMGANAAAGRLFRTKRKALVGQLWAGLDGQLNLFGWKTKLQELTERGNLRYDTDLVTSSGLLRPASVEAVRAGSAWTLLYLSSHLAEGFNPTDFENLATDVRAGLWSYNRVDDVLYLSPYLRELLGLSVKDTLAEAERHVLPRLLPADADRLRTELKRLLGETGSTSLRIHYEAPSGTRPLSFVAHSAGNALHVTRVFGSVVPSSLPGVTTGSESTIDEGLAAFSIRQADDMIFWSRPDGTLKYANQVVADKLGYPFEAFEGMDVERFVPGFGEEARTVFWERLRTERSFVEDFTLVGRSGQTVDIAANVNYLRFGDEEYACSFCRDITQQKLRERRQQLAEYTLDQADEMIVWSRPGGVFYFANQTFLQRTGHDMDEVRQLRIPAFFPHLTEDYLKEVSGSLSEGTAISREIDLLTKQGKRIPVLSRISRVEFDGEKFNCIYLRDLTVEKQQETRIQLMQKALDRAADVILWLDDRYRIRYANETVMELVAKPRQELYGKPHTAVLPLLEETDIQDRREAQVATLRTVRNDDRKLSLIASVIDAGGRSYYLLVGRDITEIDDRQRKLEAAYAEISELKDRLEADNINLREEHADYNNVSNIITVSDRYKKVLRAVGQVADVNTTVLITGETGTGKELLARAIHQLSERADMPLIKVNCAALPENLIESELFGHEKGAFTGAVTRKRGRFEIAHRGTLFLDEVGELPLELQSKLLRVLQEGEFERLGGTDTQSVDVRLVAATNRNLEKMVAAGSFRSDLYYRLNVFPIHNPPLRERPEDIEVLVRHFALKYAKRQNKTIEDVSTADINRLRRYSFPGNIRELENLVERAVVLSQSTTLTIPFEERKSTVADDAPAFLSLDDMQRQHIINALRRTNGRVTGPSGAGILLGMNDRTLVSRMRKLGIKKKDYLT